MKHNSKILITGIPKTGSTALFYSIKKALPKTAICFFEPETTPGVQIPERVSEDLLVKSFIPTARTGVYDSFSKRVLIVRDPRDQMISQMLYRPFNLVRKGLAPQQMVDELLWMLREKVKNPESIPVRKIHELVIGTHACEPYNQLLAYYRGHREHFVFKYEDYVRGNLDHLGDYLGLRVMKDDEVPITRVVRTKSFGSWRRWFTVSDVQYYKKGFQDFYDTFEYGEDWRLESCQEINPSESYLYVERLISEAVVS